MNSTLETKQDEATPGLWATLRQAVGSSEQDFTTGSIGRAIFLLSVPMVLEMLMESLFGIVNVFWVSRLGAEAIAIVGTTEALLVLVFGIAMGLSMATTALVARRVGEGNPQAAGRAGAQAILLGTAISLVLGVIAFFGTSLLFTTLGAAPEVLAGGRRYGQIILGTNGIIMLLFLNNAVFRGAGDAAFAMRALWIGNAINLVLDPCFIFGWGPFPELGVTGSAVATTIGRGTAVLYQLSLLFRQSGRVHITRAEWRPDFTLLREIVQISIGGVFQYLIATASWMWLVRIVGYFGAPAVAAYTVAMRIIVVTILPSWGIANAAATLVGQNLGAGKPERAEKSVWIAGFANAIFLGLVTIVFLFFAEPMIRFFTVDPAVVPIGVASLKIVSYGYVFYAFGMVMTQSFNGAGDTLTPTWINLACYWAFQLPLAYALSLWAQWGANGAFWAITIAESTLAVVAVWAFRKGKWKEVKV
ncbi:MAG: MATE family efflux transporter [Acidobacteria bacterium]|nr:MATE family efflux transporter [Acidobacteriota bacterium]MBI3423050.1 MATE family efflux transporter [Acidobacteriota bacterium]